jgi:hypothetical protein
LNSNLDPKAEIETVENPEHREISEAMAILVSSLEVGPDADRLTEYIGFSPELIRSIKDRLTEAGLWTDDVVNDEGWSTRRAQPLHPFIHAHVALGLLSRKATSSTIEYLDKRTGKVVAKGRRQGQ